jgi:hypothetical protein
MTAISARLRDGDGVGEEGKGEAAGAREIASRPQ